MGCDKRQNRLKNKKLPKEFFATNWADFYPTKFLNALSAKMK